MQFPCIAHHSGESLSWGRRKRHERLLEKEYWRCLDSSHLSWGSLPFVILMNANSHWRTQEVERKKNKNWVQISVGSPFSWMSVGSCRGSASSFVSLDSLPNALHMPYSGPKNPKAPKTSRSSWSKTYCIIRMQLALISIRYTYIAAYANTYSTYMILHTSMTNLRHSKSESG